MVSKVLLDNKYFYCTCFLVECTCQKKTDEMLVYLQEEVLSMKIISNYTILVHSIDLSSKMRTKVKLFVYVFLNLVKIE